MMILTEMLSYPFLVRALIAGVLVSLCAALLGTSLVLKSYSMIGDGLSHVGFASLVCAYPFGFSPLYISIPVCVAAVFFVLQLKESSRIKGDAATALYVLFFNRIFAVTFDETFAGATGVNVRLYNMVIAILTAVTVVLGMRMMGTLLISSLIVFPSLTAMRVARKFKATVILSAFLAVFCFLTGLVFSYLHAVPTGACIVVTNIILFLLFFIVEKVKEGRGCS